MSPAASALDEDDLAARLEAALMRGAEAASVTNNQVVHEQGTFHDRLAARLEALQAQRLLRSRSQPDDDYAPFERLPDQIIPSEDFSFTPDDSGRADDEFWPDAEVPDQGDRRAALIKRLSIPAASLVALAAVGILAFQFMAGYGEPPAATAAYDASAGEEQTTETSGGTAETGEAAQAAVKTEERVAALQPEGGSEFLQAPDARAVKTRTITFTPPGEQSGTTSQAVRQSEPAPRQGGPAVNLAMAADAANSPSGNTRPLDLEGTGTAAATTTGTISSAPEIIGNDPEPAPVSSTPVPEVAAAAVSTEEPDGGTAADEPPAEPSVSRMAAVTTAVNMRSGPANDASTITVVPGGKSVDVIGCNYWCEVIYEGNRGFIYKDFVGTPETVASSAR